MRSVLDGLQGGLKDLRRYLRSIEVPYTLLGIDPAGIPPAIAPLIEVLRKETGTGAAKRRIEYNSVVVTLYGLVEQFVDNLIRAYATRLNRVVPKYVDLPGPIRNHHVDLSFALLTKAEQRRFQGLVTPEGLIANLHSCLSGNLPYVLNADAFTHHTANFRANVIEATLSRLGLTGMCSALRDYPPFDEYLRTEFPDRPLESLTPGETFYYLDDLAQRRNDVSHGTPSELLANDLLTEYVDFVDAFCAALYEFVRAGALEYDVKYRCVDLGTPIAVHNHSIVCVNLRQTRVQQGDILIARTGNSGRPYVGGPVAEVQVDGVQHAAVEAQASIDVAMRVEFRAKDNYRYFLMDAASA